jgi:hypothetical protein
MGSLEKRLGRLEAGSQSVEVGLSREALRHLTDDDLDTLEDVLEAHQESGRATIDDLYRVVTEQERRALENYLECVGAIREGREPNVPIEAGEEGRERRNGFRTWQYR